MSDIPVQKRVTYQEWDGKLSFASERGHFPESKALSFDSAEALNKWVTENPGFLCVELLTMKGLMGDKLVAVLTKQMSDPEELAAYEARADIINTEMSKWRAERDAAKEAEVRRKEDEERERVRLVNLGRKCEENHGKKAKE
jgi:hypothetical protein